MKKLIYTLSVLFLTILSYSQPTNNSSKAFSVNSGVGYFTIVDNEYIDLVDNFTVEMWVNTCNIDPTKEFNLLSKGWCGSEQASYYLYLFDNKVTWQFFTGDGGCATGNNSITTTNSVINSSNTWYHLAVTFSSINGVKIYVDGVNQPTGLTGTLDVINNTTEPLIINAYKKFDGTFVNSMPGKIDEIRFWNVVKTEAQINLVKDVDLNGNENNLITYFKFEQNNAGTGINVGNSATISGTNCNGTTGSDTSGSPFFAFVNDVLPACGGSLSAEELNEMQDVTIYPNPSNGHISLQTSNSTIEKVRIYNLLGENVSETSNSFNDIDLHFLPEGSFFVEIEVTNNSKFHQQLIIKK